MSIDPWFSSMIDTHSLPIPWEKVYQKFRERTAAEEAAKAAEEVALHESIMNDIGDIGH